ncbi:MAG TPA: hypothetical protein VGL97_15025 [Bryobacteraceae bacterium]|jgi:hypothetical protein
MANVKKCSFSNQAAPHFESDHYRRSKEARSSGFPAGGAEPVSKNVYGVAMLIVPARRILSAGHKRENWCAADAAHRREFVATRRVDQ